MRWFLVLALMTSGVQAQEKWAESQVVEPDWKNCVDRSDLVNFLITRFEERVSGTGLRKNGDRIELWQSDAGKTWSVVLNTPNGKSCLLSYGDWWLRR